MTVSSINTKNSYNGDATVTQFSYTFPIHSTAELQVIERSALGVETVKSLGSHYSVVDNGSSGGTVTFSTAPASGVTVVLLRNTNLTQETDYIANDAFPAETHEAALDKLLLQIQEVQEEVDRSLKLSRTNAMTSTEFTVDGTTRASKVLGFDSTGELSVTTPIGENKGNWAASIAYNVRDIIKDTSNNNVYMAKTGHTSSGSQPISSNTDVAKWDLLVDAASATTSATNAATSATNAATSATSAATSATTATTQATSATTAKTAAETAKAAAETAKTAAETAKTAAEAALDTFDDKFLGAKSSNPTLDNDGDALVDGALYFDTTNDVMKVYDLSGTTWRELSLTTTNQTNVNTVSGQISPTNNVATLAGKATEMGLLGTSANITAMGLLGTSGVVADMNLLGTADAIADMNTLATSDVIADMNTLATADIVSDMNTLATADNVTNMNTVADNLSGVNSFAERYRVQAGVPSSSLNVGDLNFDTTANELKVYKSSGWAAAGSTVNGTSARYNYTATANQTTFTGADTAGNTLAYDAGFADVYLNGVRLSAADITITSGTSVVLATGAAVGDILDVVGYGTFNVASVAGSAINSGTINDARLPTSMSGKTLVSPTVTGDISQVSTTSLTAKGDGSSADGKITLNCSQNSHGVKIQSPAHSAGQSYTLILPTSVGTNGQVLATNGNATNQLSWVDAQEDKPTITSTSLIIAPTTATSVTIAGTNFKSSSTVLPIVEAVTSGGVLTRASVVSWASSTSISATFNLAQGDYRLRVENPDGNAVISTNAILQATPAPTWTTAAGNISTIAGGASIGTLSVVASSDSAVTYAKTSGTLPNGVTLGSNGAFAGTESGSTATTVYSFDVTVTDAESQTAVRTFTITISHGATGGGQFN